MKRIGLLLTGFVCIAGTLAVPSSDQGQTMSEVAKREFAKSARSECVPGLPCFQLSNSFPSVMPEPENLSFSSIDFRKEPNAYMAAVLAYVIEGNTEIDWEVSRNPVRIWYHAPWMHTEREPIHGLTRERGSRWRELSGTQSRRTQNWAVGFYNAPGGFAIGRVWRDQVRPDSRDVLFPVGTVTAKLLFTDATEAEAPYLYSAPNLVWDAAIDTGGNPAKMRLLQMDIAVKTGVGSSHGWVFGTFAFDGSKGQANYWDNLVPVGLEWGNSPGFDYDDFAKGGSPAESIVDPSVLTKLGGRAPDLRMGYLGRMNGPVDSPLSSCLSCHSRALDSRGGPAPDFTPSDQALCIQRVQLEAVRNETYQRVSNCVVDEKMVAFYTRNLPSDEPFLPGFNSLDYSLQLSLGIAHWHGWYKKAYPLDYAKEFPSRTTEVMLRNLSSTERKLRLDMENVPLVPAEQAFHRGD